MRKIILPVMMAAVMAFTLCLVGCSSSSGIELGKSATIAGLTCSVPLDWEEEHSLDEDGFGDVVYTSADETASVTLSYQNYDLDQTAEESMKTSVESLEEEGGYSNIEYKKARITGVSGYYSDIYEESYTIEDDGEQNNFREYEAFVMTPSMHYSVTVMTIDDELNCSALIDEILDTATIEE